MESFTKLIVLITLFGCGTCQFVSDGKCPEITNLQDNFNAKEFLGIWYQHNSLPAKTTAHSCTKYNVRVSPDHSIQIDRKSYSHVTRKHLHAAANVKVIGKTYWDVHFPDAEGSGKFYLLKTDYKRFAVVYSCEQTEENKKTEDLKILTRAKFVPADVISEAVDVIKQNKISTEFIIETIHTGCIDEEN